MGAQDWGARWTGALRKWGEYFLALALRFKSLAPYALIELILPGGSVVAILLWLYRRRIATAAEIRS